MRSCFFLFSQHESTPHCKLASSLCSVSARACLLHCTHVAVALCAVAEPLNTWCNENWTLVATQNYFHSTGLFATVLYATPLLLIAMLSLVRPFRYFVSCIRLTLCKVNILIAAAQLMVKVKRAQLRQQAKKRS
jgi:hypothetical protein